MKIVAEGVENEAIYQALVQMGCEVGQGHGIARPMPAAELMRWRFAPPPAGFDLLS
jgi:EAL domain-containing protein (putative c-di-GMP-specific phosphodiesterase class I)